MLRLKTFLPEIGIAATLGVGYVALKSRLRDGGASYEGRQKINEYPALVPILNRFERLRRPDEFAALLDEVDNFLILAEQIRDKDVRGGQFLLNRFCSSIQLIAKNMCYAARDSRDMDVLTECVDVERDELPMLSSHCENILRNAVLDAM